MADEFSPLYARFNTVEEIQAFYADPKNDMTLRREAYEYARNHPESYKRLTYYAQDLIEYSRETKRDVFLYRYLYQVLGGEKNWLPQWQKRGTCVGQGAKLLADKMMAINHIFGGGQWLGRASVAGLYAASRVEIGRQPGRWDGSTGFWVAKAMKEIGILLLRDLGLPDDATDADEELAVRWAASRSGIPDDKEALAGERVVYDTYVPETPDECAAALDAGALVLMCSDLIATGDRGEYGISRLTRQGGHCQMLSAKFYTPEGKRLFNECNSWSKTWGRGPRYPADMPLGSVNLTDESIAAQLRSGDCHVVVGIRGLDPIRDKDLIQL